MFYVHYKSRFFLVILLLVLSVGVKSQVSNTSVVNPDLNGVWVLDSDDAKRFGQQTWEISSLQDELRIRKTVIYIQNPQTHSFIIFTDKRGEINEFPSDEIIQRSKTYWKKNVLIREIKIEQMSSGGSISSRQTKNFIYRKRASN